MRLTRAQLRGDLRTVTAERDQARTQVDRLTADNFELRRKAAAADTIKAENVRLASRMERMEHLLHDFAERYPHLFENHK